MAKNQNNTKAIIALVLTLSGILSIIAAIIINGSVIVSQVGWFGAAQLNNFGAAVTIFKSNPGMMLLALALFFVGGGITKVGVSLSK